MQQNIWPSYRNQIAGCWKLVSFHVYDVAGKLVRTPHGDHPLGIAQVSQEGYLSAHLAVPDRVEKAQNSKTDWKSRSDEEIALFSRGMSMYCGQMGLFEDEQGLAWKTKVDVSSDPTRNGGIQERRVDLSEEGYMTLRPVFKDDTSGEQAVLKWKKFQ